MQGLFSPYDTKNAPQDRTVAEWKNVAKDRTAAEWKSAAKATRRRRRILQAGFFFMLCTDMSCSDVSSV